MEVEAEIADTGGVDVLGPLVGAASVRTVWDGLGRDARRAVVDVLMTVRLDRPGRGVRRFDPATVEVVWRGRDSGLRLADLLAISRELGEWLDGGLLGNSRMARQWTAWRLSIERQPRTENRMRHVVVAAPAEVGGAGDGRSRG